MYLDLFDMVHGWKALAKAHGLHWEREEDGTLSMRIPDHTDQWGNTFTGCRMVMLPDATPGEQDG